MTVITADKATQKVGNKFDLILLATRRARQMQLDQAKPLVEELDDKPTVVAMREIEEGLVTKEILDTAENLDVSIENLNLASLKD
ncbi:MAG: DNA-directed RNA polymerase subunit omega [Psittacicella sp.]